MTRLLLSAFLLAGWCAAPALAGVSLSKGAGIVELRRSGSANWELVRAVPVALGEHDALRTGYRAQAVLSFDDGSRVELGANALFSVEAADPGQSRLRLGYGVLKAFVQKLANRRFEVATPTAVCSVRGTEFRVEVQAGGRTIVDLYKGLLGVEDLKGQQVLLQPNERIQVDLRGLNRAAAVPPLAQQRKTAFHERMQRELGLEMSKVEVLSAAAREVKLAEFQQGKALIDVGGNRVRVEEYIIRPQPNQFKLVVLNERKSEFDYFYYLGTFNTALPADLRLALSELAGTVDAPPAYYLTAFQTARSNLQDTITEQANGGHPVDVNHNADPADDVAFLFNPATNQYMNVAGRAVYQTLFDNYGFYVEGKLKYGWTGANIQSYNLDTTPASTNDPITGAPLPSALPARSVSATFPDANQLHQVVFESYSDGSSIRWDNYIIGDDGRVATLSDFQAATAGVSYRQGILQFNYEQQVTATEFQGRKIDLVVAPKILVQSGLIQ